MPVTDVLEQGSRALRTLKEVVESAKLKKAADLCKQRAAQLGPFIQRSKDVQRCVVMIECGSELTQQMKGVARGAVSKSAGQRILSFVQGELFGFLKQRWQFGRRTTTLLL